MKAATRFLILIALCVSGCSSDMAAAFQPQTQDSKQTTTPATQTDPATKPQSTEKTESTTQAQSTEKTEQTTNKGKQGENKMELETATLAGGCFWCVEAVFQKLEGVESVAPGYMGGQTVDPTYKQVCDGNTGHAEVIQIKFNPEKISFEELLSVFFQTHDPTQLNKQGADVGTQYRSAVFYHSDKQKKSAETIKAGLIQQKVPIVTEITAATKMYVAEDYHHNYFNENQGNGYCRAVIPPKLEKLKKVFGDKLKSEFR